MALSATVLSTLMKGKIDAAFPETPKDAAMLKKFTDAIAEAVVEHVVSAGTVVVTNVTGVSTGGGTSGPGTGTIV